MRAARRLTRGSLRILCYHGLWTIDDSPFGDRLFMPAAQFTTRMEWLAESGFPVLPLGEAVDLLAEDRVPDGATVITIDDGWASTYTHMLPVFERLRLPATCYVTTYYAQKGGPVVNVAVNYLLNRAASGTYVLSDLLPPVTAPLILDDDDSREAAGAYIRPAIDALPYKDRIAALRAIADRFGVGTEPWFGERQFHLMTPEEIGDASARGLDIQLHTHRHRGLHDGVDHVAEELAENRAHLRSMIGADKPLDQFCYPSGGFDAKGEAILADCGVKSATLVDEGINAPGTNPYRLRRFLDGRSVARAHVHAYLSGTLDLIERVR
ncbi:MAG: polysaccharide deacetylase family protein [Pacificimonas sp.]